MSVPNRLRERHELSFRGERGICFSQTVRQKQIPRANIALGMTGLGVGFLTFFASLWPQQASAQATYTLKPTPKTVAWGYYDAKSGRRFARAAGNALLQRVLPAQTGETSEVPVGGLKNAAVLDGQGGKVRVTDQGTPSLAIHQHLSKDDPVLLAGRQ